jgi:hypothetical protein
MIEDYYSKLPASMAADRLAKSKRARSEERVKTLSSEKQATRVTNF